MRFGLLMACRCRPNDLARQASIIDGERLEMGQPPYFNLTRRRPRAPIAVVNAVPATTARAGRKRSGQKAIRD